MGHIKIRPNVDNPLTRMPIRPDVYTKAEQLRILSTPGSKIEERQYELIISNISAVTSTWSEMMLLIKVSMSEIFMRIKIIIINFLVKLSFLFINFLLNFVISACCHK